MNASDLSQNPNAVMLIILGSSLVVLGVVLGSIATFLYLLSLFGTITVFLGVFVEYQAKKDRKILSPIAYTRYERVL